MLNVKCALCVNKKWIGFTLSQREIGSPIKQAELTSLKKCWIFFMKREELKKKTELICVELIFHIFFIMIFSQKAAS